MHFPQIKKLSPSSKNLDIKGDIKSITEVVVNHMYQPWRTFAAIINKCLSQKITGLDKLRLLRAQILWGMFYKKNVDFVELLCEYFTLKIENRDHKKQKKMYYPKFTKAIIYHFITKDKSISMRNIMFMHTARDDSILGPMRFVSKFDDFQIYGALLPKRMTNQKMRDSDAYKTYLAYATEEEEPEPAKKAISSKKPATKRQSTGFRIRDTPSVSVSKKKAPAMAERSKGIELLFDAALLKEA
ncbi:hypothetical protein Tco_1169663 [Tanacetum coccineum]